MNLAVAIFALFLIYSQCILKGVEEYRTHIHSQIFTPHVVEPLQNLDVQYLPENFFWGNANSTNFLTHQRNQDIPIYCASSWAFSATLALSDRIKIKRNATWPDVNLSPQVLISCDYENQGCHGGDSKTAY